MEKKTVRDCIKQGIDCLEKGKPIQPLEAEELGDKMGDFSAKLAKDLFDEVEEEHIELGFADECNPPREPSQNDEWEAPFSDM